MGIWGEAIHAAALSVEPHSRGLAKYCTATNPFWWTLPASILFLGYASASYSPRSELMWTGRAKFALSSA